MTYDDLLKNAPPHDSPEFIDYLRKHNKVVYENHEWLVIENFKYHKPDAPWLTAFYLGKGQGIMDLWSLYYGGDFEDWEWRIKATSKQTVKRFHLHLVKR